MLPLHGEKRFVEGPAAQTGIVRQAGRRAARTVRTMKPCDDSIDLADDACVQRWIEHFGITQTQLEEAVHAAGAGPDDVERHLLDSGASAGAG